MSGIGFLENLWQDMLYALRTMRKNPAFALTAVLTLALGIGGDTALFTVIRTVLLKPLEYRDPDRLVRVSVNVPDESCSARLYRRTASCACPAFRAARACKSSSSSTRDT